MLDDPKGLMIAIGGLIGAVSLVFLFLIYEFNNKQRSEAEKSRQIRERGKKVLAGKVIAVSVAFRTPQCRAQEEGIIINTLLSLGVQIPSITVKEWNGAQNIGYVMRGDYLLLGLINRERNGFTHFSYNLIKMGKNADGGYVMAAGCLDSQNETGDIGPILDPLIEHLTKALEGVDIIA